MTPGDDLASGNDRMEASPPSDACLAVVELPWKYADSFNEEYELA
jgi:hypothetical protein